MTPRIRPTPLRLALAFAAALCPLVAAAQETPAPQGGDANPAPQNSGEAPRPAKLIRLGEQAQVASRIFYGRVVARATVDMAFQAGGQLMRMPVEEGARVSVGDLLGQLDLGPFERAERRAAAELNRVRTDLERLQNLGSDVVPQTRIDDTSTQLELAEVQHEQALYDLEHATLTAPFDALVASREAEVYATVSAGQPVVRLHDMSELRVEVEVPEILFRRVGSDAETRVEARARVAGEAQDWPLDLRELKTETGDRGQTYTVTFAFAETPPPFLLPGASVSVSARLRDAADDAAPTAPAAAIRYTAEGDPQVLVFEPDDDDPDAGVVRAAPVTVDVAPDGVLRLVEGPERGAEIVASGASQLDDGARVRRWTGFGAGRRAP